MPYSTWRALLGLLLAVPAGGAAQGGSFSGFLAPDWIRGKTPPHVPISATAVLAFTPQVQGELQLREIGRFQIKGRLEGGEIILELAGPEPWRRGLARGAFDADSLQMDIVLLGEDDVRMAWGRLLLDSRTGWVASPVTRDPPTDGRGREWFEPSFDDQGWRELHLPDDNSFGDKTGRSRYYRSRFLMEDSDETLQLVFASDDGIWIYVNGHRLGHWGAPENKGGCVNDPLGRCGVNGTVPPVEVPPELLQAGENVIAVKVHNGQCCNNYLNILVTRVRARLGTPTP